MFATFLSNFTRTALGALAGVCLASAAAAADKVVIGHGSGQIEITHPGLYLGGVVGFAEEEGLEVEVQLTQGSQQAMQLLAAGQVDMVSITSTTVLDARDKDILARIVYSNVAHNNNSIAVLADGKYQEVADFKGTDVGVFSMTSGGVPFLKAVLGEHGLTENDINMVPAGAGPAALEALNNGTISALALWNGAFAVFENQGAKLKIITSKTLDAAPGFILATTEKFIAENPEIVKKMGRIYAKAHVFAMTNPTATVDAYWKAVPANKPAEVTDKVIADQAHILQVGLRDMRVDNRPDTRFGWNDADGINAMQDYLIANGARSEKLPVEEIFTNEFVDAYNDFDVEAVKKLAAEYKP